MFRRIFSVFLLASFLLLTQQGAVLHELSHVLHDEQISEDINATHHHMGHKPCELCLAFDQVACAALQPYIPSVPELALQFAYTDSVVVGLAEKVPPRARSRSPPTFL